MRSLNFPFHPNVTNLRPSQSSVAPWRDATIDRGDMAATEPPITRHGDDGSAGGSVANGRGANFAA